MFLMMASTKNAKIVNNFFSKTDPFDGNSPQCIRKCCKKLTKKRDKDIPFLYSGCHFYILI